MTTPPKTMAEIRDAEAEKYQKEIMDQNKDGFMISDYCNSETLATAFEAGFNCRDKLDNAALKIAVESLEKILSEYAEDIYDQDYNPHQNPAFRIANEALAEICKLRGEL